MKEIPRGARMRIFRAAESYDIDETIMPMAGLDENVLAGFQQVAGNAGVELLEFRNAATFNIMFNGNDPGQWARMTAAATANVDAWTLQTKPPVRR